MNDLIAIIWAKKESTRLLRWINSIVVNRHYIQMYLQTNYRAMGDEEGNYPLRGGRNWRPLRCHFLWTCNLKTRSSLSNRSSRL